MHSTKSTPVASTDPTLASSGNRKRSRISQKPHRHPSRLRPLESPSGTLSGRFPGKINPEISFGKSLGQLLGNSAGQSLHHCYPLWTSYSTSPKQPNDSTSRHASSAASSLNAGSTTSRSGSSFAFTPAISTLGSNTNASNTSLTKPADEWRIECSGFCTPPRLGIEAFTVVGAILVTSDFALVRSVERCPRGNPPRAALRDESCRTRRPCPQSMEHRPRPSSERFPDGAGSQRNRAASRAWPGPVTRCSHRS